MMDNDKRQARRARVLLAARLHHQGGGADTWIRDISSSGALLACAEALGKGDTVVLTRGGAAVPGEVAWSRSGRLGITFAWPIDEATMLVQTAPSAAVAESQPFRRPGFRAAAELTDDERETIETWGGA